MGADTKKVMLSIRGIFSRKQNYIFPWEGAFPAPKMTFPTTKRARFFFDLHTHAYAYMAKFIQKEGLC